MWPRTKPNEPTCLELLVLLALSKYALKRFKRKGVPQKQAPTEKTPRYWRVWNTEREMDCWPRCVSQVSWISWKLPALLHLLCDFYRGQKIVCCQFLSGEKKNGWAKSWSVSCHVFPLLQKNINYFMGSMCHFRAHSKYSHPLYLPFLKVRCVVFSGIYRQKWKVIFISMFSLVCNSV